MNGPSSHRWSSATAGVALLALCGSGLTAHVADKTGSETVTLHLATIDGDVNPSGMFDAQQVFVDSLESVSGGQLQVDVTTTYGDGTPDAESRLVESIASGTVDGGWPATRAFANAGIEGLEAIEAPMTITNYAAEKELVSSSTADTVLAQLEGSGVVGLGLSVGPLRRPFAAEAPLLAPSDWMGARFRVFNSPVQTDVVTKLGGDPANLGVGWTDQLNAGELRGGEFDIGQYYASGLTTEAGFVTANVVLWPKVFVLSMSQERFDSLTDEQRGWVTEAAELATQASVDATYDETTVARELCEEGTRFVSADAGQIDALRAAVSPVIDELAADARNARLLADVQTIAERHPDPEVPDVPESCQQPSSATVAAPSIPEETATIPDGVYRVEVSLDDVQAAGLSNGPGWTGTWTLEVANGTYAISCRPLDRPTIDCGHSDGYAGALEAGDLRGIGSTVNFVYRPELLAELTGCQLPVSNQEGHCWPGSSYSMTWALDGDTLTLSDPSFGSAVGWAIKPWQRIG